MVVVARFGLVHKGRYLVVRHLRLARGALAEAEDVEGVAVLSC